MNAFIERHFALCLVIVLPFAAVAGVALAFIAWEIIMVAAYGSLVGAL